MTSFVIAGVIILYAAFVIIKKLKNKKGCGCGCSGECGKCREFVGKDKNEE